MSHVRDSLTHIEAVEDQPYLRRGLFDVNMRLFHANAHYANTVHECCHHITRLCLTQFEGYKLPHGMSAANAGIPWNIIGIAHNRGTSDARCSIMINPHIIRGIGTKISQQSNCGSIRLAEPITVYRWPEIELDWYNADGGRCRAIWAENAATIQHEVDHNNGLLITDRTTIS